MGITHPKNKNSINLLEKLGFTFKNIKHLLRMKKRYSYS